MVVPARGLQVLRVYLEMIKFEHSVFALPFAMIGMIWGSVATSGGPWPGWRVFVLVVGAMVTCRSAAMAFNRILDRDIDADNPRTRLRALPAGLIQLRQANWFFAASCVLFLLFAALLNPLALALSPVALGVTLFYSATKRFTPWCHLVLGISLGIAPGAAWVGATGSLSWAIVPMVMGVAFWTGGFDILYSLQDEEFDRQHGLRSLPETIGKVRALSVSRMLHGFCLAMLAWSGILVGAGTVYMVGVAVAAALLIYEQSLVKPNDLSRVNMAFFTLNGFVSIGLFAFALVDLLLRRA